MFACVVSTHNKLHNITDSVPSSFLFILFLSPSFSSIYLYLQSRFGILSTSVKFNKVVQHWIFSCAAVFGLANIYKTMTVTAAATTNLIFCMVNWVSGLSRCECCVLVKIKYNIRRLLLRCLHLIIMMLTKNKTLKIFCIYKTCFVYGACILVYVYVDGVCKCRCAIQNVCRKPFNFIGIVEKLNSFGAHPYTHK